ncbi:MAG: cobalamin biosynthesis protein P47K [Planctomycetales bacterium]|nr:cobalamin biosynthesis protein P47K [Planctomycetales bacterium]
MATAPRFIMIGGFLGAGKTTTIARLASHFRRQGKSVAIVTNDQATDLVDTLLLRSQGFSVGEVAGSCFCCNFDGLTDTVESLSSCERPDIILAEPVGSCTDLVATVIRPLEKIYEQPFDIAPYGVIIKPSHGSKILGGEGQRGFSPKAEYIFRKQIEEADFVILNRIDELSPEDVDGLIKSLSENYNGTPIVRMSAKTGEGFEALCKHLDMAGLPNQRVMEVDYDVYAEGEAELGWLNCQAKLASEQTLEMDTFLLGLLQSMHREFLAQEAEVAHLKAIGMAEGAYAVANLVSSADQPVLSLPSNWQGTNFEFVVNARVAISPDELEDIVRKSISEEALQLNASAQVVGLQCFRPGRPVPTHRLV